MTTINCSLNCAYQHDGKCTLDNITTNSVSTTSDCVFFHDKTSHKTVLKNVSNPEFDAFSSY